MKTNQGDIELQEIQVNKAVEDNRCECWKYNVGEQFPMKSVKKESGKCIVEVGPPHEGYSIETSIINWKMEGESKILSKDNIVIATLFFVNGVATGPCKLYDESGLLYYEGYLENGYRQGSGKEYDVSGNVVSEGFYDKGKRIKMVRMKEMKRYWKKYDEKVSVRGIFMEEKRAFAISMMMRVKYVELVNGKRAKKSEIVDIVRYMMKIGKYGILDII